MQTVYHTTMPSLMRYIVTRIDLLPNINSFTFTIACIDNIFDTIGVPYCAANMQRPTKAHVTRVGFQRRKAAPVNKRWFPVLVFGMYTHAGSWRQIQVNMESADMCDNDACDAFMVMKLWTTWKEHRKHRRMRKRTLWARNWLCQRPVHGA